MGTAMSSTERLTRTPSQNSRRVGRRKAASVTVASAPASAPNVFAEARIPSSIKARAPETKNHNEKNKNVMSKVYRVDSSRKPRDRKVT